jgi:mannan endo-1,4-beta-mannosidase
VNGSRGVRDLRVASVAQQDADGPMVLPDPDRAGRRGQFAPRRRRAQHRPVRRRRAAPAVVVVASALAVIAAALTVLGTWGVKQAGPPPGSSGQFSLPATPGSYLGVYSPSAPSSYAGVTSFTSATGVRPRLVVYYSGWLEPFQTGFAATAARHGAVPVVQIDPTGVSLTAIADGQYDAYLTSYARAVRAYHRPVVLSFGHEMNAPWYSWGYLHTSPAAFVAAWRHIVTRFRQLGAGNVTWLWTVNVIQSQDGQTLRPAAWWPGRSYVTWVGVDGYYLEPSWRFVAIFGPTIVALRELTADPILIAETSATRAAGQPAKIADLFAGVRLYGLLGFIWFNAATSHDYRMADPEAIAAYHRAAAAYGRPAS